jgi:hypothetical protein
MVVSFLMASRRAGETDVAGDRGGPHAAIAPALSCRSACPFDDAVDVVGLIRGAGRRLAGDQAARTLGAR